MTQDQEGLLPVMGRIINKHHEQERLLAYLRSRDLIKMEVLKGARLTLIAEIREIRKSLEMNTREGQILRGHLQRDTEKVKETEILMRQEGLPPLDHKYVVGHINDARGGYNPLKYPFVAYPNMSSFAHASACIHKGYDLTSPMDQKDNYNPLLSGDNNYFSESLSPSRLFFQAIPGSDHPLTRRFIYLLSVVTSEQVETDSNTTRGIITLNALKRLEEEVQLVDRMREHAERNDLMNAAAKSSTSGPESKENKSLSSLSSSSPWDAKSPDRAPTSFSIIKAHRYMDQKYAAFMVAVSEIEVFPSFFRLLFFPFGFLDHVQHKMSIM